MLNISNLKSKNNLQTFNKEYEGNLKGINIYNPSVNREWYDNIYTFNKSNMKLLPTKHNLIINLIKSYFNMSIPKLDNNIRKLKKLRKRNRPIWKIINSSKRIFISKPVIKHTNNEVIINIFIYNRQRNIILNRLNKLKLVLKNILFKYQENNKLDYLLKNEFIFLKSKICEISNNINITNNTISKLAEIDNLKRIMFKLNRLNLLKKALYINEFKFKSTYILPLVKLFEKIYGKKVTFNIISLKNYFLNSDIMNQILAYKMSKRKHRGKATKFLRSAMRNIKTPKLSHNTVIRESNKITSIQNVLIKKNLINTSCNKDKLNNIIEKNFVDNNNNYSSFFYKNQQNNILNSIKNKSVSGVRLEVAGRITRRITAQRAAYKYRYVGTLKNFDSSYKGLPSVMLRGNLGSNVQYTNLKSKTLIGSFGLKGWISSI